MSDPLGVIKLIGIAGLIDGEIFTLKLGETLSIGRSRECTICLRNAKKFLALPPDQRNDDQFRSVSRTHATLVFKSPKELIIKDESSNGSFIDGKKIDKVTTVTTIATKPVVLKLGAKEKFRLEFKKLIKRKKIKIIKVAPGEKPPPGAVLVEDKDLAPRADSMEPSLMDDTPASGSTDDPDRTDVPASIKDKDKEPGKKIAAKEAVVPTAKNKLADAKPATRKLAKKGQ